MLLQCILLSCLSVRIEARAGGSGGPELPTCLLLRMEPMVTPFRLHPLCPSIHFKVSCRAACPSLYGLLWNLHTYPSSLSPPELCFQPRCAASNRPCLARAILFCVLYSKLLATSPLCLCVLPMLLSVSRSWGLLFSSKFLLCSVLPDPSCCLL